MRGPVASIALVATSAFIGSAVAQHQQISGTARYCIKGATGPIKCEYHTRADCERAKPTGSPDQCVLRTQAEGTTGGPALREPAPAPGDQKD
jgi:hypothetical protein